MKKRNKILLAIILVAAILSGVLCNHITTQAAAPPKSTPEELKELYARSAVLIDGDSGRILFGKNEKEIMPMASTTKIMTCIITLENGDLDTIATTSSKAASQPKVRLGMKKGEQFYLKDLLYALMLESFNDAAVAIAEHVSGSVEGFADLMNEKAKELGCKDTYFITPNGLDASDEQGIHSTTAADLARILKYCIQESPKSKEFLEITRSATHTYTNIAGTRNFSNVNHNAFLSMMDGALTGKTGFTNNAGYCYVGALKRDDRTFIIALLACGWPNNKTYKWSDTKKLMNYALKNYQYKEINLRNEPGIFVATDTLKPIQVKEGIPEGNALSGPSYIMPRLSLPKEPTLKILLSPEDQITADCQIQSTLQAPITQGTPIGKLTYYLNQTPLIQYPIQADKTIEKRDYPWCLRQISKKLIS